MINDFPVFSRLSRKQIQTVRQLNAYIDRGQEKSQAVQAI
jgi:hypothetical protein